MPGQRPGTPTSTRNVMTHAAALGRAANQVQGGAINLAPELTLEPSTTTTVFRDPRLSQFNMVLLDPLTAHAAAELAAGTLYALEADRQTGAWTFTHSNSAQTDRTFRTVILG